MIAKTSSGKRFGPLADYLANGRTGVESDRVAWTANRNLGTDDPELAAALMQATGRQSALVQAPVYHHHQLRPARPGDARTDAGGRGSRAAQSGAH